jgi:hypothetical protein
MVKNFADRLWIVRKRVLAFAATFLLGSGLFFVLLFCVTNFNADPAWLLAVFPLGLIVVFGTFPTMAYFLNRWIAQFDVKTCPNCGAFLWPTQYQSIQVAVFSRCPRCWRPLVDAQAEEKKDGKGT